MGKGKRSGLPSGALGDMLGGAGGNQEPKKDTTTGNGSEKSSTTTSKGDGTAQKATPKPKVATGGAIEWNDAGSRKNSTYYLTNQVLDELETAWLRLRVEKGIRRSKSEIVEAALRLALESAQKDPDASALITRLTDGDDR